MLGSSRFQQTRYHRRWESWRIFVEKVISLQFSRFSVRKLNFRKCFGYHGIMPHGTYRHEWKNRKICSKWHAKNSRFVPFIQPVLGNKIFWGSYHDLESLFSATCDSVQIILSCKIHPSCLSLYSGIGVDSLPESRFRSAIFNSLIFIQR